MLQKECNTQSIRTRTDDDQSVITDIGLQNQAFDGDKLQITKYSRMRTTALNQTEFIKQ